MLKAMPKVFSGRPSGLNTRCMSPLVPTWLTASTKVSYLPHSKRVTGLVPWHIEGGNTRGKHGGGSNQLPPRHYPTVLEYPTGDAGWNVV